MKQFKCFGRWLLKGFGVMLMVALLLTIYTTTMMVTCAKCSAQSEHSMVLLMD